MAELLTQKQLAEWLNLSTRQVHNLADEGMPVSSRAGKRVYPWPTCLHWYIDYKVRTAQAPKGGSSEDGKKAHEREAIARADKAETDARRAALELQRELASLVSIDFLATQVEGMLRNLRAPLQNFVGRWAPQLVGLQSTGSVRAVLGPAVDELMTALTEAADQDPPADDGADEDPGRITGDELLEEGGEDDGADG